MPDNSKVVDLTGAPVDEPQEVVEETLFVLFPERDDYIGVASRNAIRTFMQSIVCFEPEEAKKMTAWIEATMKRLYPPTEVQDIPDPMKPEEVPSA